MIRLFLTGLEHRGNDATGIAMQNQEGELFVLKNDLTPWQFTKSKAYEEFIEKFLNKQIIQVVLHTRAYTKGNPRVNANNHPMYAGKAAVVHNGVIRNDDELFKNLDLPRKAETDSDILRAIVDKWGITKDSIKHMNKLRGGVATAMLHPEYPGWMLLARSGNPLTIASDENFFAFASEKQVIHRAMRPLVYRFKQWFQIQSLNLAFSPFPDHTAYLLGPEGLEWHEEFKSYTGTYTEPSRRVYQDYQERQRKLSADAHKDQTRPTQGMGFVPTTNIERPNTESLGKIVIKCPNQACGRRLALTPDQYTTPRHQFRCPKETGGCDSLLGPVPETQNEEKALVN